MSQVPSQPSSIHQNWLGLDVGSRRIGVARASAVARLAEPLCLVEVNGNEIDQLLALAREEQADTFVVGLPRGLDGQETAQTASTRKFIQQLTSHGITVVTTDEAGTSVAAEELLKQQPRPHWAHESIDAVAAMIILNDYLETL